MLANRSSSALKSVSCILPEGLFESERLAGLLDRVVASGGNWERAFGGVLLLHLPPSEESSILDRLNVLLENAGAPPNEGAKRGGPTR